MIRIAIGAVMALVLVPTTANAANIVSNGSFESGTAPGSFSTFGTGSTDITGWTIAVGSVDYIGSYWAASNGARSLDVAGNAAGTISQSLTTVAGKRYAVSFDLWANPDNGSYPRKLFANVGGGDLTFTSNGGGSNAAPNWQSQSFSFVATGASTLLSFRADPISSAAIGNPNFVAFGPALDNVSAVAVPEPAAWALMIAGFGLIGSVSRRRRRGMSVTA